MSLFAGEKKEGMQIRLKGGAQRYLIIERFQAVGEFGVEILEASSFSNA